MSNHVDCTLRGESWHFFLYNNTTMNTNGWIKLHRKFLSWEWYTDANTKIVFLHLLFNANIEDWRYKGFDVKRGECVVGRKQLAYELNLSEQQVRTALNHLISTNEITIKSTNKFSIVTICKYDTYQCQPTTEQPTKQPAKQPTSNQQVTTLKEYKNIKNIKKEEGEIGECDTHTLENVLAYAKERMYDENDARKFYLYYESQGWQTSTGMSITNWKTKLEAWCLQESMKRTADEKDINKRWNNMTMKEKEAYLLKEVEEKERKKEEERKRLEQQQQQQNHSGIINQFTNELVKSTKL